MPSFDPASLAPAQIADLRRKLEAAGCRPPPHARTLSELAEAVVEFRRRQGIAGRGVLDESTLQRLDEVSGATFQDVFREFVVTRDQCGEPNDGLTYDKFVAKLRKNKEQLVQKYACKTVRFQVYVKEGKAALKATPVKD